MKPLALRLIDISAVATALIMIKRQRDTERWERDRVSNSGYIWGRRQTDRQTQTERQRQRKQYAATRLNKISKTRKVKNNSYLI